jgi:hypothetical protein
LIIDAADALNRFLRNGLPDAGILADIASELDQYRREAGEGPSPRLTIFGNMAGLLIASGNPMAAIALERHWTALTRDLPFLTLCGYSTSCFSAGVPGLWSSTCQEHWAVSHANGV